MATYTLEIGTDAHASYRATDDVYPTYQVAEQMAKALHHPDWPRGRSVVIVNAETGRAVGFTEYLNGRCTIRPA